MSGDRRVITPGGRDLTPAARVGRPVRTGWTTPPDQLERDDKLDDLTDVDTPPDDVGVLTRTAPGGDARFLPVAHHHDQPVPVEMWLIAHNLPFTPSGVDVRGDDGRRMYPQRTVHSGPGRTRLEFPRPVGGTADLS